MKHVAAVVVTYNRINKLQQCIYALKNQTVPCDILLVDNASTDGTSTWVQQYIAASKGIFYKNTEKNIGGAGGFNLGMRWAVEAGYEFIWVMDDDCIPEVNALEALKNAHKYLNGEYGFLSSVVFWKDGHGCKMNQQKIKKNYYEKAEFLREGIIPIEQATFVSTLFPAEIIRQVGLPIKEFFVWGDDIEYTRRISVEWKHSGYLIAKSNVIHMMDENTGSDIALEEDAKRIERYKFAFRNEQFIYRREGIKGKVFYAGKVVFNLVKIWMKSKKFRVKKSKILLTGAFQGITFHPEYEYVTRRGNR